MKEFSINDNFIHFDGCCGVKGRNEVTGGQGGDQVQVIHGPKVLFVIRKKGEKE
jgi:hypothetical protein